MKLTLLSRATVLLGLAAILIAGGDRAYAVLVNGVFSGTVTTVGFELGSAVSAGDTVTGSFQYDSAVADAPSGSSHFPAITDFSFDIGSGAYASTGFTQGASGSEIRMFNDFGFPTFDQLLFNVKGLAAPQLNGFDFSGAQLTLIDSTESIFSTAAALPTSLNLSDFDANTFTIFFFVPGETATTNHFAHITMTLTNNPVVPEPATISLIGMGLAGLGGALRRRRSAY